MADEVPPDESFRLPVEDGFTLTARRTAIVGYVESGTESVGDRLSVVHADGRPGPSDTCVGVDMPCRVGQCHDESAPIRLIFRELRKADFEPSDIVVRETERS